MIRGYQKRDLPDLYELDQVCFPPEIAYSHAELQYFLSHPATSCWVADEQDGSPPAGFLILERALQGQLAGHIVTLDVAPAARRRGLGALLMQTAETQMKQEGATRMLLEVAVTNVVAQQFYRRLGFAAGARIANYYGGRIDAEAMEKLI